MASRQLDEEAIFHVARDIVNPESRAKYLEQICAGDLNLRNRVEELLKVDEEESDFLKSSPAVEATVDQQPITERPGITIGRYRLMEQIGEGGMGVVFVAEQQRPLQRKVALKVIKPGMDSKAVIARFDAERQALALMDHHNIAKVLDAGTTDSGRPYFVMELVRGVPITEYCDQNKLSIRERLDLFIQVCQAIQHAHQKGIIHRDIKPSNVLITLHDGEPVVKVIDFGVAKALNQKLTEKTIYTSFAQIIGTPLYMSPEQAELSGLDVDTRTDVYSLGVLLYELLTGTTPFDRRHLDKAAYDEIRRIIREQEPPKPSTRISTLGATLQSISTQRKMDPRQLCRFVRGDLDWIVMMSLEKDRTRRYDTASSFAADVRRFLEDEPVEARAPSTVYRIQKFAARNRLLLTAALLFLLLVLGGIAGIGVFAVRAAIARQDAIEYAEELKSTNVRLSNLIRDYRDQQTEAALMLAFGGQLDKTMAIAEDLETILTALDPAYQRGAASSLLRGIAYFYRGEESKAREQLELAVQLDPKAIAPNAILAVANVYDGDWAVYLDNISELQQLKPRMPLDEVFLWYGKLYADPQVAAKELARLVPQDSESAFGQALVAAALAHAAIDSGKPGLVETALVRARIAEGLASDNPFVLLMSLYAHDASIQLAALNGKDTNELKKAADLRAAKLAAFDNYSVGRYELALFFERTDRSDEAREHWRACGMIRDACAVFERDGCIDEAMEYLEAKEDSRYNQLARLLLQVGKRSNNELLNDYRELLRQEPGLAFRIEALELPLRLGMLVEARADAEAMLPEAKKYEHLGLWITPLAQFIAEDLSEADFEAASDQSGSRYMQLHTRYWIGLRRLAENDRGGAIEMFEKCLRTGAFDYSSYGYAQALLERLKDPSWPPRE